MKNKKVSPQELIDAIVRINALAKIWQEIPIIQTSRQKSGNTKVSSTRRFIMNRSHYTTAVLDSKFIRFLIMAIKNADTLVLEHQDEVFRIRNKSNDPIHPFILKFQDKNISEQDRALLLDFLASPLNQQRC